MVQLSPLFILASLAVVGYSAPIRPARPGPPGGSIPPFLDPLTSSVLGDLARDARSLGGQSITGDLQGLGSETAAASKPVVNSLAAFGNSAVDIALDPRTINFEARGLLDEGEGQSITGVVGNIGTQVTSELRPAVHKSSSLADHAAAGVLNLRTIDSEETDPFDDEVPEQPVPAEIVALLENAAAAANAPVGFLSGIMGGSKSNFGRSVGSSGDFLDGNRDAMVGPNARALPAYNEA